MLLFSSEELGSILQQLSMGYRAWYKNKKGCFYILLLLQIGAIIFTATYAVLSVNNTESGKSVATPTNNDNNKCQTSPTEITQTNQSKPILMFIAIMSAPERIHRRNALRRSWLRQCQQHNTSCYMFTDALDMYGKRLPDEIHVALEQEQFLHQDLILAESPGGINFATRYLWIIKWANRNYKFDFLLRVDDDYFICMDRLFLELPYREMVTKLYWGHIHCSCLTRYSGL